MQNVATIAATCEKGPIGLVLTRDLGEQIVIDHGGERLVLTVVKIVKGRVRLGLKAAKSFQVVRIERPQSLVPNP